MALNYITLVLDQADGTGTRSPLARRCSTRRRSSPTPATTPPWCLQDGRGRAGVPDRLGQMLAIGAAIQSDRPV